jgi:CheY-like chemotaxis protein
LGACAGERDDDKGSSMSSTDTPVHVDYCRGWVDELRDANADMAVVEHTIDDSPPDSDAKAALRLWANDRRDPDVVPALIEEAEAGSAGPRPTPGDTEPSVLVVDDDATLCLALKHGLTSEGFRVRVATTATEAYHEVGETCFDIILLDWILPGGDSGYRACRRLRYLHPSGEIVVLTGLGDVRDQRAALDAGAIAFLQKGISLEALAERLHDIAQAT